VTLMVDAAVTALPLPGLLLIRKRPPEAAEFSGSRELVTKVPR
jgi:hypothetical protein